MKINKDSLAARINRISKEKGINANVLYSRYFFDCFLTRLAKSKYADKFILKGGLYLSSILGIENRFTMDIDFLIQKIKMEHDNIVLIVKEICNQSLDDNVNFKYIGDSKIKKDDIYGGFSIVLEGNLENVRQCFDIDLATGDVIYPKECNYEYDCIITNETINLKSYPIESIIAEKIQTFLVKGVLNSRSKDFYDLYILEKMYFNNNNINTIKKAFYMTCKNRNCEMTKDEACDIVESVKANIIQQNRWDSYSKSTKYASGILFDDVLEAIRRLVNALFL